MECSIGDSEEPSKFFSDEDGTCPELPLPLPEELLSAIARLEKLIRTSRRIAGLTDDQKWRLVCAGSLIGVAGSHLKIFSERKTEQCVQGRQFPAVNSAYPFS